MVAVCVGWCNKIPCHGSQLWSLRSWRATRQQISCLVGTLGMHICKPQQGDRKDVQPPNQGASDQTVLLTSMGLLTVCVNGEHTHTMTQRSAGKLLHLVLKHRKAEHSSQTWATLPKQGEMEPNLHGGNWQKEQLLVKFQVLWQLVSTRGIFKCSHF